MSRVRGIFKRGTVYWIQYAGPDGRIVRESAKTKSIREAEYFLACRKKDIIEDQARIIIPKRILFKDFAVQYLRWAERQKSYKDKRNRMNQLITVFGNLPLNMFTSHLIEQYQSERLETNRPATVNRFLSLLKHSFTKAVEWDMASEETLKKIGKVKLLHEDNRRLRFLSKTECQTLIETCTPHLKPIVIVALNTGMRLGEILGLRWEQVDLRHGFILLDKTKNGERREIPINSVLRATLEAIPHGPESEYVFVDRNGRPYKSVNTSFPTACKRAGITDFRFHDLRHTFASHLRMAGVDIVTIKELLGHKTLTMTLRYAHLFPGHRAEAVSVLEERLSGTDDKNMDVLHKN
ncbi:MAG: hypothetical protein A3D89_03630 [Planctomycetes bacterium RIFCSPHIGHO2_02_FULL_52_58]|nr:MAG: hypothetical protein A3D89_03630 [Planctomycetes bacterium RIFCSPHIGHO2_02_FULL_52_58]